MKDVCTPIFDCSTRSRACVSAFVRMCRQLMFSFRYPIVNTNNLPTCVLWEWNFWQNIKMLESKPETRKLSVGVFFMLFLFCFSFFDATDFPEKTYIIEKIEIRNKIFRLLYNHLQVYEANFDEMFTVKSQQKMFRKLSDGWGSGQSRTTQQRRKLIELDSEHMQNCESRRQMSLHHLLHKIQRSFWFCDMHCLKNPQFFGVASCIYDFINKSYVWGWVIF